MNSNDVTLTRLKQIGGAKGMIMHGIKATDDTYSGFGEAYFSSVHKGDVKGWKRHREMVCNLIVVNGAVEFFVRDDREGRDGDQLEHCYVLSRDNYCRLTIPAGCRFAFKGIGDEENLILNISSIPHDDQEVENLPIKAGEFD